VFDTFSGLEILTIAVVALVVFGPHRLPDIARLIGKYVRELRDAVRDLREGIEREVAPLREPMKEIRQDLAKPVGEVKRTLAETADAAGAAERDIRQSLKDTDQPAPGAATPVPEEPEARWVAPEPPVGVSPSEAWEGVDDPMPENVVPPEPPDNPPENVAPTEPPGTPPENGPDVAATKPPAGEGDQLLETTADHEDDEPPDRGE